MMNGWGNFMQDRILIVDDEEAICSILIRRLTKEGYSCLTASNGVEALNLFYKDAISLIISDIEMPEMDGIELLRRVKAINTNILIVMMAGDSQIETAVEAMRLGAYDSLVKPVNLDLVVLSVRRALEK